MENLAVGNFARQQHTPTSGNTYHRHYADGDWETPLLIEIAMNWELMRPGDGRTDLTEVIVVPLEPQNWIGTTVTVKEDMVLTAKLDRRREGEDPYISVRAVGATADYCEHAYAVLYHRSLLNADDLVGCEDAEWVVVCVTASPVKNEPMHPLTIVRNLKEAAGGTRMPWSRETLEKLVESVWYWKDKCKVQPKEK